MPDAERSARAESLRARGMLVVELDALGPAARGRLADVIDDAVERELTARGGAAPGIGSCADRDAALSDQLFRLRRVGAQGLCVSMGTLRGATSPLGALEPEDGATLRFLAAATKERPLSLLLHEADATLGAYADPVPLARVVNVAPPPAKRHVEAGIPVAKPDDAWRHWTLQLSAAKGPQSLASFERLFCESYMPLANAIAAGLDDARALHAHEDFRRAFAKSYSDACPTFALTGKRPRMVLDAFDVTAKIGRLHGARAGHLLMVPGLRWDMAQMLKPRLTQLLGARASLTDELILFAALPSSTPRQIETLARGVEALRGSAVDSEPEPLRGRTAEVIRRVKVGARELHRLDLVDARVRAAGAHILEEMPNIALATAQAVARHAEHLAARTLLLVFGDRGFTLGKDGAAQTGGASPEEVLSPALALLIDDVH